MVILIVQVEETSNENNIRFDVNGTEAMVISSTAKVGIGTDTPVSLFHINSPMELGTETLDQQQNDVDGSMLEHTLLWQSFTAGITGYLSKVDVWNYWCICWYIFIKNL